MDDPHCRRRGDQLICSTENGRDPYVCELRVLEGVLVAPRADWELYHSLEDNRAYGLASLDGATLSIEGDAGRALAAHLGGGAEPVTISIDPASGAARLAE